MGVKIRVSKNRIYLDIYLKGTRKWEKTGLSTCKDPQQNKETMRIAEILRSKRETQLVAGENDLLDPIKSKDTLYAYMLNNHSKASQWTAKHLKDFPGGTRIKLSEVSKTWINKFKDYLTEETGLHQNTARNYLKAIKQNLRQAVTDRILPRNPADGIGNIKFIEPDRVFLNQDEVKLFAKVNTLSEAETTIKRAFIFACLTGIRLSDIKTLKWENIDHSSAGTLLIKRQKKTKTKLYNHITESAWKVIDDQTTHQPSHPVFPYMSQVAGSSAHILARLGTQAGITKRISWHVARRTFALWALENGIDIFTLSKLLGHLKLETTLAYLKMTNTLGKKAVSSLPEISLSGSEWHPPAPSTPQTMTGDPAKHKPQGPPSENTNASPQD
jgi:site-specific recombinase XerD